MKLTKKSINSMELLKKKSFDHFVDINKTIPMPKGATKEIDGSGIESSTFCRQLKFQCKGW